jgi:hypothetical protein
VSTVRDGGGGDDAMETFPSTNSGVGDGVTWRGTGSATGDTMSTGMGLAHVDDCEGERRSVAVAIGSEWCKTATPVCDCATVSEYGEHGV